MELDLSLSLNGRFGSDPQRRPKDDLERSSSSLSLLLEVPAAEGFPGGLSDRIARSCSLPVMHGEEDVEEKGRKMRKEMQSLRRMEVMKRRMEKHGGNLPRGRGGQFRSRRRREPESDFSRSRVRVRGCGSSGGSSESNSLQDKGQKASATSGNTKSSGEHTLTSVLEAMPCVCAKVDGPNSGRVEGFLFRYRKGDGFKIVCICHGRFLSPAEFVEHAGGSGRDLAHPLKHIVVCTPAVLGGTSHTPSSTLLYALLHGD
ncbi:hypothetical protein MLD38_001287 [Melastoma candidum]|uniref:Uncharacterized protein n=1 Tax=Melastoma candidum TaxID=119954 RepID=A0ACB9SED2_9MYRT|nr:hypothetical protein MLD38_001287 [Melastoma candidum]